MKKTAIALQWLLALQMLLAGFVKISMPYEQLAVEMPWVNSFSELQVMLIGIIEGVGALGLIIPSLIKRYYKLMVYAALGLALTMLGAVITEIVIGGNWIIPLFLMILALIVAWLRNRLLNEPSA